MKHPKRWKLSGLSPERELWGTRAPDLGLWRLLPSCAPPREDWHAPPAASKGFGVCKWIHWLPKVRQMWVLMKLHNGRFALEGHRPHPMREMPNALLALQHRRKKAAKDALEAGSKLSTPKGTPQVV